MEQVKYAGIIITTRYKIESALKEKHAYNEKTAVDAGDSKLDFGVMLEVMEKNGLVAKTAEGKIYMTKKGQEQQIRGVHIHKLAPTRKIKRYSKNK